MSPHRRLTDRFAASMDWCVDRGVPSVESLTFGTADPAAAAHAALDAIASATDTAVATLTFTSTSIGVVVGVELLDGRRVVLKAFQPSWTERYLQSVIDAQVVAVETGIPAPEPVCRSPLAIDGGGFAVLSGELVDPGARRHPSTSAEISASGLAAVTKALVDSGREWSGLQPHPLNQGASDGLYGEPHSPLFDFDAIDEGAEWIDDLARAGATARDRDHSHLVPTHTDWAARNVRMSDSAVTAIYDWDSLRLVPISAAVGATAITWQTLGEADDTIAPSLDDAERWVAAFSKAHGPIDEAATFGSALFTLCYTARCEHTLERLPTVTNDDEPVVRRWARDRLRADGESFAARCS